MKMGNPVMEVALFQLRNSADEKDNYKGDKHTHKTDMCYALTSYLPFFLHIYIKLYLTVWKIA